jgi:hypothetical protein
LHAHDVNEREPLFTVRRVFLPVRGIESFTVIGPDLRPVELVDEYLRKSLEQIAVEDAAGSSQDYEVFMAVADHIGHDKRGNVIYVRDPDGNEVLEEVDERIRDVEDSRVVYTNHRIRRKKIDDSTAAITAAFRKWRATPK